MKSRWTFLLMVLWVCSQNLSAQDYPSGDADIDGLRLELKGQKTNEDNYKERTKLLYMWMGAL
ncbi:MAG: hypothetical protein QNK35_00395, partial [Bacteroides sp.]|nr:hypothetical protein [Bacteroides sp.]